jgi:glutathione S-transferase
MPPKHKKPRAPPAYPPPENTKQVSLDQTLKPPLKYVNKLVKHFSLVHHPPVDTDSAARLVSVGISHYVEKVRWGFDIKSTQTASPTFGYVEDAHPPAIASLYTTRLEENTSATPIIQFRGEDNIIVVQKDSTEILRKHCPFLYPEDLLQNVLHWEEKLNAQLGPQSRVLAYEVLLEPKNKQLVSSLGGAQTSWIEAALFKLAIEKKVLQKNMKRFMAIDRATADRSKEDIFALFEEVGKELESKEYIAGDRFTAADVTFAALSSPLLGLDEFGSLQPPISQFPQELRDTCAALRATKAGQHAVRCYGEYRFATLGQGGEVQKSLSAGRRVMFRSGGPRNNFMNLVGAAAIVAAVGIGVPAWGIKKLAF